MATDLPGSSGGSSAEGEGREKSTSKIEEKRRGDLHHSAGGHCPAGSSGVSGRVGAQRDSSSGVSKWSEREIRDREQQQDAAALPSADAPPQAIQRRKEKNTQ